MRVSTFLVLGFSILFTGCASLVTAQPKQYSPGGEAAQPWLIGGTFDPQGRTVTITINGDNVMVGRFPPYTPRLSLPGQYEGHRLTADCEFTVGIVKHRIAEAVIQKVRNKSGNTCEILVDAKPATTLYF